MSPETISAAPPAAARSCVLTKIDRTCRCSSTLAGCHDWAQTSTRCIVHARGRHQACNIEAGMSLSRASLDQTLCKWLLALTLLKSQLDSTKQCKLAPPRQVVAAFPLCCMTLSVSMGTVHYDMTRQTWKSLYRTFKWKNSVCHSRAGEPLSGNIRSHRTKVGGND